MQTSIRLTANQHRTATLVVDVAAELLKQGSPDDDTPLEIDLFEALEVAGKKLAGN